MAKTIKLCDVHSFSTLPKLSQRTISYNSIVFDYLCAKNIKLGGDLTMF